MKREFQLTVTWQENYQIITMAKEMHIWNSSLVSTSHASHNQIPMNRSSTFRRTWNEKKAPNQRYNANMLEDACSKSVKIGSAWRWTVSCEANFSVGFSFQKWQRANVQAATICNAFRRQFKNFFENVRESERRSETESSQVFFFSLKIMPCFVGWLVIVLPWKQAQKYL